MWTGSISMFFAHQRDQDNSRMEHTQSTGVFYVNSVHIKLKIQLQNLVSCHDNVDTRTDG